MILPLIAVLLIALAAYGQPAEFEPVNMGYFQGEYQMVYSPKALQCFNYADIDNDGVRDIVTSISGAYLNEGTDENPDYRLCLSYQGLNFGLSYSGYSGQYSRNYYADFDNDNLLDRLNNYWDETSVWYMYHDTHLYLSSEGYSYSSQLHWDYVYESNFGDINDDGLIDLINNSQFFINIGTPDEPDFELNPNIILPIEWEINPLILADIDNDVDLDYFVYHNSGWLSDSVYFFRNTGSPQNPQFEIGSLDYIPDVEGDYQSLAFEDNDLDGDLDLFLDQLLYENIGSADSAEFVLTDSNCLSPFPQDVVLLPVFADLDLDGDQDFIPWKYNSTTGIQQLVYYQNEGTIEEPDWDLENENLLSITCQYIKDYEFADLDADGDSDLLITNQVSSSDKRCSYYRNEPDAQGPYFTLVSPIFWNPYPDDGYFRTVDWDGDGDYDIIEPYNYQQYGYGVMLVENTGSIYQPQFFLTDTILSYGAYYLSSNSPTIVDLDNDGDYDILWDFNESNPEYSWVRHMYYRNDGTLANPVWYVEEFNQPLSGIGNLWGAKVYDFDNNGYLDIFPGAGEITHNTSALLRTGLFFFRQTVFAEVGDRPSPPQSYALDLTLQPNPFNQQTLLTFSLYKPGPVKIAVYDVLGREVEILSEGYLAAGEHQLVWQAKNRSSGVYFVRLLSREDSMVKKAVVLK